MRSEELADYRRRAGNLRQADLIRLAIALGFRENTRGGKGSHIKMEKVGRRPVTIPTKVDRSIALAIIDQLEGDDA
jgi:predicted RNA binding protein YcfA (HicA-like mRNA interferase family)